MSALKDEWSNLIRHRGAGAVESTQAEDLKSRLISSFKSVVRKHTAELVVEPRQIEVRKEFEALRLKVHSTLKELQVQAQQISKTTPQETTKQYIFGLNTTRALTVSPLKPTTGAKKASPGQIRCVDDIYRLEDTPIKSPDSDPLEGRFEIGSIASKKTPASRHVEDPQREISFLSDISPIARFMANMREDEEQLFYQGVCALPGVDVAGCVHLMEADSDQYFNDRIEFEDALQFVMGRLPRQRLLGKVGAMGREQPHYEDTWRPDAQRRRASDQQITISHLQSRPSNLSAIESFDKEDTISITVPPELPEAEVEQRLMELLEVIRSHKDGRLKDTDFDLKLQQIISQVDATKLSRDNQSLKMRLLIQFITEYRKAQQHKTHKPPQVKPLVPRTKPRPAKAAVKPTTELSPEDYVYKETAKVSKMKGGWGTNTSPAVLNSRYAPIKRGAVKSVVKEESKWIGGLKHRDELEGEWESDRTKPTKGK
jgi:predicted metal-dependent hydrolase